MEYDINLLDKYKSVQVDIEARFTLGIISISTFEDSGTVIIDVESFHSIARRFLLIIKDFVMNELDVKDRIQGGCRSRFFPVGENFLYFEVVES